ncbi:BglG family transcription antiterminator [Bacillus sp. 1P06AnD]|uniref:BglG family transcription antiterminator n=1 Tax=Bacillus sp. 1P06AnD TaxID=3132208 RepID=UPI00399FF45C
MNNRKKQLLEFLIHRIGTYTPINEITFHLECSEKTVRSDLKDIDYWLAQMTACHIERVPGKGVAFIDPDKERDKVLHQLVAEGTLHFERFYRIINMLLLDPKKYSVQSIADKLYVSKKTIQLDLKIIRSRLKLYRLQMSMGKFISIIGKETDIRFFIEYYFYELATEAMNDHFVSDFLGEYKELIEDEIILLERNLHIRLTENAIKQTTMYIYTMIRRLKLGHPVEDSLSAEEELHPYFYKFKERIDSIFSVNLSILELYTFSELTKSGTKYFSLREPKQMIEDKQANLLVDRLLYLLNTRIGLCVEDDKEVLFGLKAQMLTSINRTKNGFQIYNPECYEVRRRFWFIHSILSDIMLYDELFSVYQFNEMEIAHFTYYIAAVYEGLNRLEDSEDRQQRVLVVSSFSYNQSLYIQKKIEKNFNNIRIIDVIRDSDLSHIEEPFDFIIAFTYLPQYEERMLVVSPYLEKEDLMKIYLYMMEVQKNKNPFSLLRQNCYYSALTVKLNTVEEVVERYSHTLESVGAITENFKKTAIKVLEKNRYLVGERILLIIGEQSCVLKTRVDIVEFKNSVYLEELKIKFAVFFIASTETDRHYEKFCNEFGHFIQLLGELRTDAQINDALRNLFLNEGYLIQDKESIHRSIINMYKN